MKVHPEFPIENFRKIIDTGNRIIHGYDNVSDEILWSIVIKYLPDLKQQVSRFIGEG